MEWLESNKYTDWNVSLSYLLYCETSCYLSEHFGGFQKQLLQAWVLNHLSHNIYISESLIIKILFSWYSQKISIILCPRNYFRRQISVLLNSTCIFSIRELGLTCVYPNYITKIRVNIQHRWMTSYFGYSLTIKINITYFWNLGFASLENLECWFCFENNYQLINSLCKLYTYGSSSKSPTTRVQDTNSD